MMNEQPASIPQPSLRKALFYGLVLVVVDGLLISGGLIAVWVGLWQLLVGLPRTLLSKKYAAVRRPRLRIIAVYFVAVILVFVLTATFNRIAQSRAETLVAAIKTFHTKNQRYPKSLAELVPNYYERLPRAKDLSIFGFFYYSTSDQETFLFYVDLPPFGRPTYSFTRNEWGYLD